MVDILSLVLQHVMPKACFQHDEEDVLCAVELALEAGVPTKTHILNLLHRLIDRKPTDHPEVDPPPSRHLFPWKRACQATDALALQTTPEANVDRYDGLRQAGETRVAPKARAS